METFDDHDDSLELREIFETLSYRYTHGQGYPPLTEQEFVDAAIDFANADNNLESFTSLLFGTKGTSAFQSAGVPSFKSERDSFRSALSEIACGSPLSDQGTIAESAERMVLIPCVNLDEQKLKITHRHLPQDLSAALAYVLILFADTSKSYGHNLKQCQLKRCQRFFFVQRPKTGRPRTTYCSDKHMNETHRETAPQRVRKSRAKKRRSTKRKKQ